VGNVKGL